MERLYAGHDLEMIRKAVEVQELWKPRIGDYYIFTKHRKLLPLPAVSLLQEWPRQSPESRICKEHNTWLPRQDQLQNIAMPDMEKQNNWMAWMPLLRRFDYWLEHENTGTVASINPFKSIEQLWLAFVMKEKFKKTWSGTDWEGEK